MEHFCSKCSLSHSRPVGRWCNKVSMVTNLSSAQAREAASAVRPREIVYSPLSPISSLCMDSSTGIEEPGISTVAVSRAPNVVPSKTEELMLNELQKLSARMSQMEQEMQGNTFTSTTRRRKRVHTSRIGRNSAMGTSNLTGNQTTLDDSAISSQQNHRVSVPAHTQHVVNSTTTTTRSLEARTPLLGNQIRGPQNKGGADTLVVFSTCQTLHQGQYTATRTLGNSNTHIITTAPNSVVQPRDDHTAITMRTLQQAVGTTHGYAQQSTGRQGLTMNATEPGVREQFNLTTGNACTQTANHSSTAHSTSHSRSVKCTRSVTATAC